MNTGKPDHYLTRTDDRYISHYVYQSCFRSLPFLDEVTHEGATLPVDNREKLILKDSGIVVDHSRQHGSVYVNARKGGIITIFGKEGVREAEYGWRGKLPGRKIAVTHWLRMSYDVVFEESDRLLISGKMSAHSWMVPTPFRHIVLRAISRLFGNRLIPSLKKAMIFGDKESGISFTREITFHDEWMDVEDVFKGTDEILKGLYRAPHYSMRHVSSAGLFVPEELIAIPASEAVPGNGQVSYKRTISYGPLTG